MNLRNLSIKRKLMLSTMLTSAVSLLLVASVGVRLAYDWKDLRRRMADVTAALAEQIGLNSTGALVFRNETFATNILSTTLRENKQVVAAALYTPDGQLLAHYPQGITERSLPQRPENNRTRFEGHYLKVFRKVVMKKEVPQPQMVAEETYGTVYIQFDMRPWYELLQRNIIVVGVLTLGAALLTLWLSWKLQRAISEPILGLAHTMKRVSAQQDYSLRAVKSGEDEIGTLIDGFNTMLSEIQQRDAALQSAKEELEERVQERTQALEQSYQQLQELEKLRDDLTHMIVHDLRTPLTSIISALPTMPRLGELNNRQMECLNVATQGGQILLGMINDLLDISKMEEGSLHLEYENLTAADIVERALQQVTPLAQEKELTLVCDVAPHLPIFSADKDKLLRTLVNLLGNAVKFTPAGGMVTVSAHKSAGEEAVLFAVTDTGEGIPEEARERIFEKFGQVEARKSRQSGSTGLGLTFCKMAVEAHGGRIQVESAVGRGSTFSFTIPLKPPHDSIASSSP